MRPVILVSALREDPSPDELDDLAQLQVVSKALRELGYDPEPVWLTLDMERARAELRRLSPPFVFNLVEEVGGEGRLIHLGPALLDSLRLPYTGCPTEALLLCSNKVLAKKLMRLAGLPTPEWVAREDLLRKPLPQGKLIVKSVWEHASKGLDEGSVIGPASAGTLALELEDRSGSRGGECLAECYIDGREFNLSILEGPLGPQVLPVAEILFQGYGGDRPRIVCYRAKWDPESFEFHHTPRVFSFPDEAKLLPVLQGLALKCWRLFGLRGYARVDVRVDRDGKPWILEINPNPCLSPDGGFMAAAVRAGLDCGEVVARILEASGIPRSPCVAGPQDEELPEEGILDGNRSFRQEVLQGDLSSVRRIVLSTGLFRPQEVEVAVELVQENLSRGPESGYQFLFAEDSGKTVGYACFGPIACTASSFDLYWIAVERTYQARGIGKAILSRVEELVSKQGGRRLYVETSSRPGYEPTRSFYFRRGYIQEAILQDFYGPGDHKVILAKELAIPQGLSP